MKGIVLAGGTGSRLYPATLSVSKQLIPVYDKPMIYYPIATLMEAGIRDILIITTEKDADAFKNLLGDGSLLGCEFSYAVQDEPKGIAEAFSIGASFIGSDRVCLILGDNIFYGKQFQELFKAQIELKEPSIFALKVQNPSRYGVVEFDSNGTVVSVEEKPIQPKSNYAIPGLYIYDSSVVEIAENIQPSARGEKEITSIHQAYLDKGNLSVGILSDEVVWMDAGTPSSFTLAHDFVKEVEQSSGTKIACLEEIAYTKGYISKEVLQKSMERMGSSDYGNYLKSLI
jgi:glucose-1-phosphate thymidylyltransferase